MIDYKLLVDTAMLAGEIMLSSGAETYRVEDTMCHILKTSKCKSIEALALMTGIVVTINDESMQMPTTMVTTIKERNTNLNNIIKVNAISRKYCGQEITLEEAYEQLKNVKEKQYNRTIYNIATVGIATGFAMMFGGNLLDVTCATVIGILLAVAITVCKLVKMDGILSNILSGFAIGFLATVLKVFLGTKINMDIVIVSTIMPIVPGVAITNAIRDTLHQDYLSGCARILEAFLIAATLTVGVGLGMIGGGLI